MRYKNNDLYKNHLKKRKQDDKILKVHSSAKTCDLLYSYYNN